MLELTVPADQLEVPVYSFILDYCLSIVLLRARLLLHRRQILINRTAANRKQDPLGRHELAGAREEVLRLRGAFDYALQRVCESWG